MAILSFYRKKYQQFSWEGNVCLLNKHNNPLKKIDNLHVKRKKNTLPDLCISQNINTYLAILAVCQCRMQINTKCPFS